ncbi:MAG: sigma-70 family RNA polymerase sigma factor [Actinobacteria bacterium]|nr:MAG: sigma-70 family RNA polymerase sigma factor [Actinomycetota bacterium]
MERFEQIYEEHREAVRAFVRRRAPESVVDDVVSETFLVCWRKLDRVPAEPRPWLYAVARKTLANQRRRLAREQSLGAADPASAVAETEPVGDTALAAGFAALSERDREVLRLIAWEGLSLAEAAVVLGCSALACRVRYHRAKTRLARRLEAIEAFRPDLKGATR